MNPHYSRYQRQAKTRFQILFYIGVLFFLAIVARLFWLQVLHGADYRQMADEQSGRGVVIPAKRGNIYAKDYRTGELFPLAQNSTSYTIFADPFLIESGTEAQIADQLLPYLWQEPVASEPSSEPAKVKPGAEASPGADNIVSGQAEVVKTVSLDPKQDFRNSIISELATKDVVRRTLDKRTINPKADAEVFSKDELQLVQDAFLPGVGTENNYIVVNPVLIENPSDTAVKLATLLEGDYDNIYQAMLRKKRRYVRLASRVAPLVRDEIIALSIRGVGAIPEYRRVYPEHELAAQVIGYLNHDEEGQYGIEGSLNQVLAGRNGIRRTQVDPFNRQITVGNMEIQNVVDGTSLVLTIDRAIQEVVEKNLSEMVDQQRADAGQAIVMDPYTGAILALANYPTFDPNNYGDTYLSEELIKKQQEKKWVDEAGNVHVDIEEWWESDRGEKTITAWGVEYVVRNGYYYKVFTDWKDGKEYKKYIFKNRLGEEVFALKAVNEPYEPGSVFKPIVMAMAVDAGEVKASTRSPYNGPVELDEVNYRTGRPIVIKNAEGSYHGQETMAEVIANSSNIGMTFIAQQLGRATFYDYLKKFGFGERSGVEFMGEAPGSVANYTKWTESELITKAFGQGITANLFQIAAGYSALANGGLLMRPYIVDEEILPDGRRIKTEPETVRRVINADTSREITKMMIYSSEKGYAKRGKVDGYYIAGKTGTSQTYYRGRALTDIGTTIAAFGGYAPATNPKFVLIVKLDRPRVSEWGEATAAPIFKAITEYLLKNYFMIPPNETKSTELAQ